VRIVDTPEARVHHPADLVGLLLSAVGIAVVCVLAVYAQNTTTGVAEDVQGIASIVRRLLFVPVAVLEGLITFVVPIAVLVELGLRRLVRQALESVAGAVLGVVAALVTTWLVETFAVDTLRVAYSVVSRGALVVTVPALLTGAAALLTVAGTRDRRRTVRLGWNLLWLGLGVALVTGAITVPGALMTVLLGRLVGLALRYASGVESERAYGAALVDGVRRAGFEPVRLVRVRDATAQHAGGDEHLAGQAADLASQALTRHSDHRVYAMTTAEHERFDVLVLDGDRQVVGLLLRFWRSMRLRGIDGRTVLSLRQVAERASLLSYAAASAGVATPRLLAMAESEDSMLLVHEHVPDAVPLADVPPEAVSDDVLDAVWEQLRTAHQAGLAHRALTADVVLVRRPDVDAGRPEPEALLIGWEQGDVASSELARRVDVSQMLALLALIVGAGRAVGSAARVLPDELLATTGPLLQTIALPRATRELARAHKGVLAEVREALLERLPQTDVEPESLVRFGARTVLTLALTIAAGIVVITTINFQEITGALADAEPWWALVAFGSGMATFVGAALALVAFSPVKLPLWRATLVQCAAAFVALVAPAGVGPAALNLRMLTRRGVSSTLAAATVGLVQVSGFLTTLLLLLVLSLVSGTGSALQLPSTTVLTAIAVVLVAAGAALLVPAARRWVAARAVPLWRQTWPRLVQLLAQPRRFAVAAVGNLIMTLGYLGAFAASLAAFGQHLSLIDLALIYLIGNTAGALIPTPGGLGTIEATLIAALIRPGGVPTAIATSVVVLFRALTFWGRIPFGWLAMRVLQRAGEL
jgi:uncharacterized membrane protein YbhN (UPF0104 family)/tRNA A-37 threonylcarbamoyl transferase component Bud32